MGKLGWNPGVVEGVCREPSETCWLLELGRVQPQQGQSRVGLPESLLDDWAGEFPVLLWLHF